MLVLYIQYIQILVLIYIQHTVSYVKTNVFFFIFVVEMSATKSGI